MSSCPSFQNDSSQLPAWFTPEAQIKESQPNCAFTLIVVSTDRMFWVPDFSTWPRRFASGLYMKKTRWWAWRCLFLTLSSHGSKEWAFQNDAPRLVP